MSQLLSLFFTLPLALFFSLGMLVYTSLEPLPLVTTHVYPSYRDVQRMKNALKQQDPRHLNRGDDAQLIISERDLDLLLSNAGLRLFNANSRYRLEHKRLHGQLTWRLPLSPDSPYLNVSFDISESDGKTTLKRLSIGHLELPLELETRLLSELIARMLAQQELSLLQARVWRLHIEADRMVLIYHWDPEIITQARDIAMSEAERERTAIYANALALELEQQPRKLHKLLPPMFEMARQRSQKSDPMAENRAALTVLGLYALGGDSSGLLGIVSSLQKHRGDWVTLQGRKDLSRHFLVSAAIAAGSDTSLSDAIGVYKEWNDSHGGSGFSFVDLTADRAGSRFGELATRSPKLARRMQEMISAGVDDASLLPPVSDLPENMSERNMRDGFGGIGGTRYQQMIDTIEQRLSAMPLYRLR